MEQFEYFWLFFVVSAILIETTVEKLTSTLWFQCHQFSISIDLKREKIVLANSKARVILAPLKPGEYKFFGEFHEDTAQGKIIVKEKQEDND